MSIPTESRDCSGRIIRVGDLVAYNESGYTYSLFVGEIVAFTPKMVKVQPHSGARMAPRNEEPINRYPCQLCRITNTPEDLAIAIKEA